MDLPPGFFLGPMGQDELPILDEWAAAEGWNPGLADLQIAWAFDPAAFVALREGTDLAGAGTIISYGGKFGFMGLFIVRRDLRRKGLGAILWHHRLNHLRQRLNPSAAIGMDGVFDMVPFYERGGFSLAWRDLRFQGTAEGVPDNALVDLRTVPAEQLFSLDRQCFQAERQAFLGLWINQPGAHSLGLMADGRLVAMGVIRPCRVGFKMGPVFAGRPEDAERLIQGLLHRVRGEQVQWDIPEPNSHGLAIATRLGFTPCFACARMYHGPAPDLPVERIYAVTSFEFG